MIKKLPFWIAYARAVVVFFGVFMAMNWLAYALWGGWLDWRAVLLLAGVTPGIGLMVTWDEM